MTQAPFFEGSDEDFGLEEIDDRDIEEQEYIENKDENMSEQENTQIGDENREI